MWANLKTLKRQITDHRHTLTTFDPNVSKDADVGQRHVCYSGNYKHDHNINTWICIITKNKNKHGVYVGQCRSNPGAPVCATCGLNMNTVTCISSKLHPCGLCDLRLQLNAQNNFRESLCLTCSCWSSPAHRCQGRTPLLLLLLLGLCLWISSVSAWTAAAAVSSFLSGNWVKSPRVESGCLPGWESRGSRVAPPGCPRGWSLHPLHLWGTPTSSAPSSPSPVIWGWTVSGLWACWTYSWCPPCEQELLAAGALRHWLSGRTCRAGYRERTDVPTPGARNQVEERWTNKRSPKGKHTRLHLRL